MDRMRDRLADRDLEIKILQKRMNLRRGSSQSNDGDSKMIDSSTIFGKVDTLTNFGNVESSTKVIGSSSCSKCREKDGLVTDLYQKVRNLENIIEAFCSKDEKGSKNLSELRDSISEDELDQVI
jgi:hypothetical protein